MLDRKSEGLEFERHGYLPGRNSVFPIMQVGSTPLILCATLYSSYCYYFIHFRDDNLGC